MKQTIEVLEGVRKFLSEHVNDYIDNNNPFLDVKVPALKDKEIMVDYPDIDSLPSSNTVYIIPDYMEVNPQTTCSYLMNNSIKVFLFCKRDKHDNLIRRASTYANAIMQVFIRYTNLGGAVNLCEIQSADFYPSVTADNSISAYEITVSLRYVLQV